MRTPLIIALLISAGLVPAMATNYYLARSVGALKPSDSQPLVPTKPVETPAPAIAVNMLTDSISAEFGDSAGRTYTVTNTGNVALKNLTITGGTPIDCGTTLSPGQSCAVSFVANTQLVGTNEYQVAVSAVSTNNKTVQTGVTVSVTVEAPLTPLTLDTDSISLTGELTSQGTRRLTLTNANGKAISISGISFSGGTVTENNCGESLPAGQSCQFSIWTQYGTRGTTEQKLTIDYNLKTAAKIEVPVYVTGTLTWQPLVLVPSTINLSSNVGTAATTTVTLRNPNVVPVAISSIAFPAGTVASSTCLASLPAGQACTFQLRATPVSESTVSGTVTATYTQDAQTTVTAPVSITGVDPYANLVGMSIALNSIKTSYTDTVGNVFTWSGSGNKSTMLDGGVYFDRLTALVSPQNAKWALPAQFTVEAEINHTGTAYADGQIIGVHQAGVTCNWMFFITGSGHLAFHWGPNLRVTTGADAFNRNTWNKVSVSRGADGNFRFHLNGTLIANVPSSAAGISPTAATPVANSSLPVSIGNDATGGGFGFRGGIRNVRITSGVARY